VGRPRIHHEERVTTAVRLPRSLHERLRAAADERQVAANLLVQKALEDYLRRLRPVADLAPLSQPDGTVER
jgi:predicted HicB family RNase H-like nuclease